MYDPFEDCPIAYQPPPSKAIRRAVVAASVLAVIGLALGLKAALFS